MNLINTNQNAQYGIAPFDRKEIIIGAAGNGPDRSRGALIPELEGTGFYVERCDYPVLVNIGHGTGGLESSYNMRDGLEIQAPFKGLTLTHPVLNSQAKLTLILFKNGASMSNNLDNPVTRLPMSFRAITTTGVLNTIGIFVPPGSRSIKNLLVAMSGTTVTGVNIFLTDINGSSIIGPTNLSQVINGFNVTYPAATGSIALPITSNPGGQFLSIAPNIFLPTSCVEVIVQIVGTALVSSAVSGNFE